jgi:hypothetical protein
MINHPAPSGNGITRNSGKPRKRRRNATQERLHEIHAAVLLRRLESGCGAIWLCREIAKQLSMTLPQLQRAAVLLEGKRRCWLEAHDRGVLILRR